MKYLIAFSFIFISISVFAQEKIKDSIITKTRLNICSFRDSSDSKIDLTNYSKIAICSMEPTCKTAYNKRGKVIRESCWANSFIRDGKLIDSSFIEIKFLNDSSMIELTSILHSQKKNDNSNIRCYNPRNAILFFDEKGKIKDCIELCFECEGNRTTFSGINQFDLCFEQYKELKDYFGKLGVKRGIIDSKN